MGGHASIVTALVAAGADLKAKTDVRGLVCVPVVGVPIEPSHCPSSVWRTERIHTT